MADDEQERDLKELYPTQEAWEQSYPPLLPPKDAELRQQYDDYAQMARDSPVNRALQQSDLSTTIAAKRQQHLDLHDRVTRRGATEAARDALHDGGLPTRPGAYTTYEARDRAAHTPPAHTREPDK